MGGNIKRIGVFPKALMSAGVYVELLGGSDVLNAFDGANGPMISTTPVSPNPSLELVTFTSGLPEATTVMYPKMKPGLEIDLIG